MWGPQKDGAFDMLRNGPMLFGVQCGEDEHLLEHHSAKTVTDEDEGPYLLLGLHASETKSCQQIESKVAHAHF